MSLIYYDTALKEKFSGVFKNTFYATTDEAFKACARINGGKVLLPLISIFRPMGFNINNTRYNEHEFRKGYSIQVTSEEDKPLEHRVMRALPVRLQYQIDIWAISRAQCDKLTEEIIMFLLYEPYIEFEIPNLVLPKIVAGEEENKKFRFALKIEETIQDNSDVMSFDDKGRYYRNTFEIYFEEPRIFNHTDFDKFAEEIEIQYIEIDSGEEIDTEDLINSGGE